MIFRYPDAPASTLIGVPLHIVQRGQNREPRFFTTADCVAHLE